MKAFYRRALVVPTVLPSYVQTKLEPWDSSKPILSVVIPCYNYGRYIRETLESLRSQTFIDFETIVVDDGSDEELTLQILNDLRHEGVQVLQQEKVNAAAALNLGIGTARGRYVCRLDADDTIEPTYLEKSMCLLESNPGVAFVYSSVKTFGDEKRIWITEPFDLRLLLEYNYICAGAVFRRSIWEAVDGFDQTMDGYEDWDFWLKVGKAGFRGKFIPETLFNYRRHGTTLNIRSDRRYMKLITHIRANHSELYSHVERITEIQRNYRDIRAFKPFINLSSKSQYGNLGEKEDAILVLGLNAKLKELIEYSIRLRLRKTIHFVLVATSHATFERHAPTSNGSNQSCYCLDQFLDPSCWLDFVINLINTRSARIVLISNSALDYEWTQAIKTRTSAFIVNVIADDVELLHLSAKFNESIDLHIVFSEHAMKSLVSEFDILSTKIFLLAKTPSIGDSSDLLDVLITHAKKEHSS